MLALNALAVDLDLFAIDDLCPAVNHLNPVLFQQCRDATGQAVDDAVLPLHALGNVQAREATLMPSGDGSVKRLA